MRRVPAFLSGGGEMGALMRAHDWATSPLGSPDGWPQSLRTVVGLMLDAKQAMFVAWGPQLAFLYNDAYAPIFGRKHPHALGRPFAEVWADIWEQISPLVDRTLAGEATWFEDLLIPMERRGFREEAWFTFSYTPVRDDDGAIAGIFCAATETTAKVLTERRVLAERERLKALFEQAPSFMAMVRGPDHVFELANPAYMQLVGYRDVIGKPVREALPEVDGQGFFELLDQVYRTGEPFVGQSLPVKIQRHPGADPEGLFVNFVYQPIKDADGRVTGIFCEGSDITDAKMAERALRESEARLRLALAASRLGDWELNVVTGETWRSPLHDRIFGYPEPTPRWSYDIFLEHVLPEDRAHVDGNFRTALEAGGEWHFECRIRRPDGAIRWIEARGTPVKDARGRVERLLGVVADVSERKMAEEALRASEARFRTIAEALPGFAWTADARGEIDYVSRRWEEYSGAGLEGAGGGWLSFLHPDDRAPAQEGWAATVGSGDTYAAEFRLRERDGSYRWWLARALPVRGDRGAIVRWVGTCTDIHDRKVAEEALRNLNETLEQRVAERTAEREAVMAQLAQAQKMEAVGQLTGGVAHDFNNLLQAMSGCLKMIERRAAEPAIRPLVEAGRQAVDRGAKLVQQLMAFARRQALRPEPVDVRDRVLGMSELLTRALRGNIRVETGFEAGLWPVVADPTQFELTIINLAVNARDAMPDGGRLRIEARNIPATGAAGDMVCVSVSDTGTGMAPEVQARAFDPFFTTKPIGEGSGLGLAQVYGFARQSGGSVEIDSAHGRGTTVRLFLPRTREAVAAGPGERPAPTTVTRDARVLLVEDDPVVATTMAAALEDVGYEVVRAMTADEAQPLLASKARFDVLFSDVVMPGRLSGVDLAQEARRLRPGLPVLLTTGYSEDVARLTGVRVLPKPYQLADLIEALETVLANRQEVAR